ncbi:MAG: hypothetical protein ABIJ05_01505 [Patescibacteria group bacterium]
MKKPDKLPPEELDLKHAVLHERQLLGKTEVPIITISATYRKELADKYYSTVHTASDVVFSRAHYSMAEAVREAANEMKKTAHMSDPTNFVSHKEWSSIEFTETVGQLMARNRFLKWIKDRIDTIVRSKLPIGKAVFKPLEYLSENINCPVISLHYEVGNILVKKFNKNVIQMVTDPHVRPQYLYCLPSKKIIYCLFDEETKEDFLLEAKRQKREVYDNQLIVTGPPVDPRICEIGKIKKKIEKGKPINLAVCTGGLGTNLSEIKKVLEQLAPLLKPPEKIRLFLYAGTHRDFRNFFEEFANKLHIRVGNLDDEMADIRILYEDSIVDANNNLIKYMFPWAHGVVTKPSGDMAYDAAAAGCFMLFLEPWGVWEENIQKRFIKRKIGFDISLEHNYKNLLLDRSENSKLMQAMENSYKLPNIFREGSKNIVNLQQTFLCNL